MQKRTHVNDLDTDLMLQQYRAKQGCDKWGTDAPLVQTEHGAITEQQVNDFDLSSFIAGLVVGLFVVGLIVLIVIDAIRAVH